MMSFKNLPVSSKNIAVFSVILSVTLSCYILVFYFSSKQKSDSVLVDISGKNRMLSQRIGAMSQLVGCANDDISQRAKEELKKAVTAHTAALNVLKDGGTLEGMEPGLELPASEGKIRDKIVEIQDFFARHKELVNTLLESPKSIQVQTDSGKTETVLNPKFQAALEELQTRLINGTLLKHNIELTSMFVERSKETKANFLALIIILFVLNILSIVLGYILFNKFITLPIKYLSAVSDKISKGDAGVQSTYKSDDDIGRISDSINILTDNMRQAAAFTIKIGQGDFSAKMNILTTENTKEEQNLALALSNMKQRLVDVAEEDKKRKWVSEGLAHFVEILRSHQDTETFASLVLKELIRYIKANQGGIFIVNDSDKKHHYLELVACYAYERTKFVTKIVEYGEGLVGQAFLEKDKIFLTQVPNNYVNITSGLGEANPRCVLIVPLKNNETIEGILEIASFSTLEEHEILFVEKVAESIAATLSNIRINEQTRRLLMDSQQQAEELKSQEEEMRQNMEELSATQEEMTRKELEYIKRIEKLEADLQK